MKSILVLMTMLVGVSAFAAQGNYNLRLNAHGPFTGMNEAVLDVAVDSNIVIGPTLLFWDLNPRDVDFKAQGLGVKASYFLEEVYNNSFYGELNLMYVEAERGATSHIDGTAHSAKAAGAVYSFGLGHAWFFGQFNANLGLTLGGSTISKIEVKDQYGNMLNDNGWTRNALVDFKIGYVF